MSINLHLLRVFMAVAENNSFSRAADVLYISQPAVSKGIQELEQQLGFSLFDRSRRTFTLTEAGKLLYPYAQRLFAVEKAAEIALEQLQSLERGHLAIGASHTTGTYLLPALLSQFHHAYPGIHLSLEIVNTQTVLDNLRTHSLDLAFVEGPVKDSDFTVIPWRTDRLVVIAPLDHPLVAQQPISLDQLVAEPYVQREVGSGTREIVENAFAERGLQPNVAIELSSNQAVKQTVSAGLGISIVSEASIALELMAHTLATIEVAGGRFSRVLSQVLLKEKPISPAAAAFQELVRSGGS